MSIWDPTEDDLVVEDEPEDRAYYAHLFGVCSAPGCPNPPLPDNDKCEDHQIN